MDILIVSVLVVFGVALMLLELFLIPGFGIAGVASVCALGASTAWAYMHISPMAGHITLLASLVILIFAIVVFLRGKALEKMALNTTIQSKVDLLRDLNVNPGDRVVTVSRLAPMGKVRVGETDVEAKSTGVFVDQETVVEIVKIEGNVLVVKPVE